jgi:hypothetical protein
MHRLIKGWIIAVPHPTAGSQTQASQDRARHHRPIRQDICGDAKQVHVSSRRYSSFSPLASGAVFVEELDFN